VTIGCSEEGLTAITTGVVRPQRIMMGEEEKSRTLPIPAMEWSPKVNIDVIRQETLDSWDKRAARVHQEARAVRNWRRQPQRQLSFVARSH